METKDSSKQGGGGVKLIGLFFVKLFENIGLFFVKTGKNFIYNPIQFCKLLIPVTAIVHLILSSVHINILYLLSNMYCGLYMFMFILFGLACLFNAVRIKEINLKKIILNVVMLCVTIFFGAMLTYVYIDAILNQGNLDTSKVYGGLTLAIVMISLYLIGIVQTIRGYIIFVHKENKKKKELI